MTPLPAGALCRILHGTLAGFFFIPARMNHRQHPGVIRSAAVAYAVLLLKRENIGLNKIKVSEMGKYFDVLRIICHTEKKEEMESHQNR